MQIFRCCVTGCITERALTTVAALVAMHLIVLTALYAQLSASTCLHTYIYICAYRCAWKCKLSLLAFYAFYSTIYKSNSAAGERIKALTGTDWHFASHKYYELDSMFQNYLVYALQQQQLQLFSKINFVDYISHEIKHSKIRIKFEYSKYDLTL